MSKYKDAQFSKLNITNNSEVKEINNDDDSYIYSSLTCNGGLAVHKGLSIGMQDKMVSGLMIYDNENFYGYSDKYGLVLLSNNSEYRELEIPDINSNRLSANDILKENEKKKLNINLILKDNNNYFLKINKYVSDIELIFDIQFIIDDETMLSNYSLVVLNESEINININFIGNNLYFSDNIVNNINKKEFIKYNINFINNDYILVDNIKYFSKQLF